MEAPTLPSQPSLRNTVGRTTDTAIWSHCVSDAQSRTGDLRAGRDDVLRDLRLVPETSWESFLKILPPSPLDPGKAERVLAALNKDEIVDNEGGTAFAAEPGNVSSCESKAFRFLDQLFDDIVTACKTELATKPGQYKWTTLGDTPPKSACKSTCKPDAWLVLNPTTHAQHVEDDEGYYWEDCCLPAQFKKETSFNDIYDARTRISSHNTPISPTHSHA